MGKPDSRAAKLRRLALERTEGKCSRCPAHDVENRERRPRPDRYKNKRDGSRKGARGGAAS